MSPAGFQLGHAVPVGRSIQLINQAIDRNQNSESDVHPEQRNKHQYRDLEAYDFRFRQKNNRARETSKRNDDASNNF
jgi:hypothetical protein